MCPTVRKIAGPVLRGICLLLLCAFSSPAAAQAADSKAVTNPRQQEVEEQISQLQKDISALQQSLQSARSDHLAEQQQLKDQDISIQKTRQAIRSLDTELKAGNEKLVLLEQEREHQWEKLQLGQSQLAEQINDTYRLARQSRLKLVLNQDNAADLGRMLAYYEHINQAQTDKILTLRLTLEKLQAIAEAISVQLAAISNTQLQQEKELSELQNQQLSRQKVLADLQQKIGNDEAQLEEFEKNRQDLERVLEKLSDVLADIPPNLGQYRTIQSQKGQLATPVKAKVRKAFGQQRSGGMYWQGWVFDASPGSEISSIAYGRVAFADWLRGYGLMIIIDHGEGFMSLYGYNESLLWEVGDWVEPGSVLATAGSNSAGEQGLYFELRKDGKALDPAGWLKR